MRNDACSYWEGCCTESVEQPQCYCRASVKRGRLARRPMHAAQDNAAAAAQEPARRPPPLGPGRHFLRGPPSLPSSQPHLLPLRPRQSPGLLEMVWEVSTGACRRAWPCRNMNQAMRVPFAANVKPVSALLERRERGPRPSCSTCVWPSLRLNASRAAARWGGGEGCAA